MFEAVARHGRITRSVDHKLEESQLLHEQAPQQNGRLEDEPEVDHVDSNAHSQGSGAARLSELPQVRSVFPATLILTITD